jgi:hypothetical protein
LQLFYDLSPHRALSACPEPAKDVEGLNQSKEVFKIICVRYNLFIYQKGFRVSPAAGSKF